MALVAVCDDHMGRLKTIPEPQSIKSYDRRWNFRVGQGWQASQRRWHWQCGLEEHRLAQVKERCGRQEGMVEGRSFRDDRVRFEKYKGLGGARKQARDLQRLLDRCDICLWGHNHVRKHGHLLFNVKDMDTFNWPLT